ncbi:MAG TPA: peptidase T [Haliscomenobacter sp.]|uniref:peptidase T n=1 Tax=Haliscomenobacter sp. TaxID=2717303 RepID=UPI002D02774D|nr:peptidase T [Haliscomenobacter sp.]HOY19309.1 peptidase T [Haliscomenobacter sp.]
MLPPIQHSVLERFLRYVQIDTQSDPHSKTFPSTEKQKDLGRVLAQELQAIGASDAHLDEHGYVYATIPATVDKPVPVICFCSHMDTSPDSSGTHVKPIIHSNYDGRDLVLPDDPTVVIRLKDHPNLAEQMGNDIVTASGLTLLGADNKAGVAEIMDAAQYLLQHPEIPHGKIRILFTPDEEVGRGVEKVDLQKLGADFGYTIDGENLGAFEDETFSADAATLTLHGVSAHPGFAKGKMESALKIAGDVLARLPKDRLTPEAVAGRDGFIHPVSMEGIAEKLVIHFIIRDFTDEGLAAHEAFLHQVVEEVMQNYPNSRFELQFHEQYRNMKKVLDQHPQVSEFALEAIRRAGIEPIPSSVRGGTDGSRLSYMGLPCPNIFAGEHAFHSKQEWVSVQDMEKAVETIVHLAMIWAE